MAASVARLVLTWFIFLPYIAFAKIILIFLFRQNYDDIITVLTYGDSSTSSDSSDEDLLDEIFVSSMFPDYKVDYPRTNIDDLNESQCVAMFRYEAM